MNIEENKSLKELSSFQIGGTAKYAAVITEADDVALLYEFAQSKNLPLTVIGKGTNALFKDGELNRVIGIMDIQGIRVLNEFEDSIQVEAGGGVIWDDLVEWAVQNKLTGIEALSAIPGTVGAAPVQNIGAYGSELSDTFVNVKAYDTKEEKNVLMGLSDCEFDYRDSIFKHEPGRYIITSVTLELSKKQPKLPKYKDVQMYFLGYKRNPSLKQIRKAIIEIRKKKLPQPDIIPNVGSFFKNPIIQNHEAKELLDKNPDMPHFVVDDNRMKLYAGWLIEKSGFKDKNIGPIKCYKHNALVLTKTKDNVTFKELEEAYKKISRKVKEKFGVTLEMEPRVIE